MNSELCRTTKEKNQQPEISKIEINDENATKIKGPENLSCKGTIISNEQYLPLICCD